MINDTDYTNVIYFREILGDLVFLGTLDQGVTLEGLVVRDRRENQPLQDLVPKDKRESLAWMEEQVNLVTLELLDSRDQRVCLDWMELG